MTSRHDDRALTLGLCAAYFLVLLDVTIVNVALPRIGDVLGAGPTGLAWVVDAYSVPLAAGLLTAGAVGDRVGHRRIVLTGFAGFGLASLVCAAAPVLVVLVVGRAVQGAAAALMLPGTLALLTEAAPDEGARSRAVGLWAAVGGAALPAGPLLGGALVTAFGWRSVFSLGLPVIIAASVPVARTPERPGGRRGGGVNWAGAGLLVVLIGALVTAIIEAPQSPAAGAVAAALAIAAALMLARVERAAPHRLLSLAPPNGSPATAGTAGRLAAACAAAGLMNLCMLGSLFLLTQDFQGVRGMPPLTAGLLTVPLMAPLPLLGVPTGRLVARTGPWAVSALGLGIGAAGLLVTAAAVQRPGIMALGAALTLLGCGIGVLTPAVVAAAVQAAPQTQGAASGASNTARQTAGALGVALFGALAGGPGDPGFVTRVTRVLVVSGAVFAAAALAVLVGLRRR